MFRYTNFDDFLSNQDKGVDMEFSRFSDPIVENENVVFDVQRIIIGYTFYQKVKLTYLSVKSAEVTYSEYEDENAKAFNGKRYTFLHIEGVSETKNNFHLDGVSIRNNRNFASINATIDAEACIIEPYDDGEPINWDKLMGKKSS